MASLASHTKKNSSSFVGPTFGGGREKKNYLSTYLTEKKKYPGREKNVIEKKTEKNATLRLA